MLLTGLSKQAKSMGSGMLRKALAVQVGKYVSMIKTQETLDKNGLLELQANDIYRKEMIGSKNKLMLNLTPIVQMDIPAFLRNKRKYKAKVIVESKKNFSLSFESKNEKQ